MFGSTRILILIFVIVCHGQFLARTAQQFPQGFLQGPRFQQQQTLQLQPQVTFNPIGRILEPPIPQLCANHYRFRVIKDQRTVEPLFLPLTIVRKAAPGTTMSFIKAQILSPGHNSKLSSALFPKKLETLSGKNIILGPQCQVHETFGGKGYWFSWKDSVHNRERDWLEGRNFCRQRCMDLVSLETSVENEFIKQKIIEGQQKYIWTSGRLCDFKGCEDREDLKPIAINGWFWSGELRKLAPVTNRLQNDWSPSGGINKPQPDNREFIQGGAPETCLAILNNFYGDGIHWHDVACHHKKPIVCEDSEALLRYVRYSNTGSRV